MKQVRLSSLHLRILLVSWGAAFLTGLYWIGSRLVTQRPLFEYVASTYSELLSMKLHGGVVYLTLLCTGSMVWHIQQGWKTGKNRISGAFLCIFVLLLALTGWGLYYIASDTLRAWTSFAHIAVGWILVIILLIHARIRLFKRLNSGL